MVGDRVLALAILLSKEGTSNNDAIPHNRSIHSRIAVIFGRSTAPNSDAKNHKWIAVQTRVALRWC